jgi:hypothetical protein
MCAAGGGGSPGRFQKNHFSANPREMVRFFHRRSSCSCLKDLYYNLKDKRQREYIAMAAKK